MNVKGKTMIADKEKWELKDVTLATVLKKLLAKIPVAPSEATYIIRRDAIEITTSKMAAFEKVTRVYPVADLLLFLQGPQQQQQLATSAAVRRSPAGWLPAGFGLGQASSRRFPGPASSRPASAASFQGGFQGGGFQGGGGQIQGGFQAGGFQFGGQAFQGSASRQVSASSSSASRPVASRYRLPGQAALASASRRLRQFGFQQGGLGGIGFQQASGHPVRSTRASSSAALVSSSVSRASSRVSRAGLPGFQTTGHPVRAAGIQFGGQRNGGPPDGHRVAGQLLVNLIKQVVGRPDEWEQPRSLHRLTHAASSVPTANRGRCYPARS